MMAASTMAPMAIAMPPSDMMLEVTPLSFMGIKETITAVGIVRIGIKALGRCQRNNRMMALTISSSSSSVSFNVSMERRISSERSYVGTILTPFGSDASTSRSFALTPSITFRAFSPNRTMTMPPTTSPFPSSSAIPRRISGPKVTRATSWTRIGVPLPSVPTGMVSMSAMLRI